MRVGLLVLLAIAVTTAPVVPALGCVGAPASESQAEQGKKSCCCCPDESVCACGGCCDGDAQESEDAPSAEQACLCGRNSPQNREKLQAVPGGAEVRLAACISTTRDKEQPGRRVSRAVEEPRQYPHPEVRPPLQI